MPYDSPSQIEDYVYTFRRLEEAKNREQTFHALWPWLRKLRYGTLNAEQCMAVLRGISFAFDQGRNSVDRRPASWFYSDLAQKLVIWERHTQNHFDNFDFFNWSRLFAAYSGLRILPGQKILTAWQRNSARLIQSDYLRGKELALFLPAFGRLRVLPEDNFIIKAREQMHRAPEFLLQQNFAKIVLACAWLDALKPHPDYRGMVIDLHERGLRMPPENDLDYLKLRDASLWLNTPIPPERTGLQEPAMTSLETKVSEIFQAAGLHVLPKSSTRLGILKRTASLAIKTQRGIVHVDIDGPNRVLQSENGEIYSGVTLFEQKLITRFYPDMAFVRVPMANIDALYIHQNKQALPQSLKNLFEKAACIAAREKGLSAVMCVDPAQNGALYLQKLRP